MRHSFYHGGIRNENAGAYGAVSRPRREKIPGFNSELGNGKRTVPFPQIQEYRRQHEQDGVTAEDLCKRTGHNIHTMRMWLRYINRVHA